MSGGFQMPQAPGYDNGGGGYPPPGPGYPPMGGGAPYPPVEQQPGSHMMQPLMTQQPQGHGFGAPVTGEEGDAWMGPVGEQMVPLNCPPGLEYLTQIDQLIVKQKLEILEAAAGVMGYGLETANKYKIKNVLGQNVYKAKEDTDCCTRYVCGPNRPFDMIIKDNMDREVIHLNRPLRCDSCCFPCCLQSLEISSPPGEVIGYVNQLWSCMKPKFEITDGDGNVALIIKGPWCTFSCAGDVEFKIMTPDGENEVGRISKQWTGLIKEAFTDMDNFGITFPMDLDVRCKATLIGACFLIDYMFFEKKANQDSDGLGMMS